MQSSDPSLIGQTYAIVITAYSGLVGPTVPKALVDFNVTIKP